MGLATRSPTARLTSHRSQFAEGRAYNEEMVWPSRTLSRLGHLQALARLLDLRLEVGVGLLPELDEACVVGDGLVRLAQVLVDLGPAQVRRTQVPHPLKRFRLAWREVYQGRASS